MSACTFSIPFSGQVSDLVAKAKNAIQGAGGTFDGDLTTGSFTVPIVIGKIVGKYVIEAQQFKIDITEKPMMVPCGMIEDQLKKYLSAEAQA